MVQVLSTDGKLVMVCSVADAIDYCATHVGYYWTWVDIGGGE